MRLRLGVIAATGAAALLGVAAWVGHASLHPARGADAPVRARPTPPQPPPPFVEEAFAEPSPSRRAGLVARAIAQWARQDAAAAWRWSLLHPHAAQGEDTQPLPWVVLRVVAQADPDQAVRFVRDARADARSPGDCDLDTGLSASLLGADRLPLAQSAMEEFSAHPAVSLSPAALENVALCLQARLSSVAAASWLESLPDSEPRARALAAVTGEWAMHDPEAAATWLLQRESAPAADLWIEAFVVGGNLSARAPAIAKAWASLIRDPAIRAQTLAALEPPGD